MAMRNVHMLQIKRQVESMCGLHCLSLNRQVTWSMSSMFYEATSFNQNIGAWNTAEVPSVGQKLACSKAFALRC